ncbi:MAG: hypothetical protein KGL39_27935 [Patescibacteria group bacterium]|nr:hypothetical protein [Patescibacteria group bacterium]
MKTMTQAEWLAEGEKRFGKRARDWRFVCPACGTVQSVQQYLDAGLSKERVHAVMAYSCVGRYTGQGDQGIAAKARGETWTQGCNWTLGGLFQIHTMEVLFENGKRRPVFEFAEPIAQAQLPAASQPEAA